MIRKISSKQRPSNTKSATAWALIAAVAGLALPTVGMAQVVYETRALTGVGGTNVLGPGLGVGVTYSSLTTPTINDSGILAFGAALTGTGIDGFNDFGLWVGPAGSQQLTQRKGDVASDTSGATYAQGGGSSINVLGRVTFQQFLNQDGGAVTAANDQGLWTTGASGLELIAREGSSGAAPGPGLGANISYVALSAHQTNGQIGGQHHVSYRAQLGGSGVTPATDQALFVNSGGATRTTHLLAQEGTAAPGIEAGVNFGAFASTTNLTLNAMGTTAFYADLVDGTATVASTKNSAIWTGPAGNLSVAVREDDQIAGLPTGAVHSFFDSVVRINKNNAIVFTGGLRNTAGVGGVVTSSTTGNSRGLFAGTPGNIKIIARRGEQAPGTAMGVQFQDMNNTPLINDSSEVAFIGKLRGTDSEHDDGIWATTNGVLQLVARQGDDVAGISTPGVNYDNFASSLVMNALGNVAFTGGVKSASGYQAQGLFATNGLGNVELIALQGTLFDVDNGLGEDLRTISSISFPFGSSGGGDGNSASFNANNVLAFQLLFTDGSNGIFTAAVPEPASLSLLAMGAATLLRRRRR